MTTFDFEREEEIESALAKAVDRYRPPAGLKEAIRERLFGKIQDLTSAPNPSPATTRSRRMTPRRIASYAAGLAVVASLLVMLAIWGRHVDLAVNVAFADVQEAIRHVETAIAVFDSPQMPWLDSRVLERIDCDVIRQEWPNGAVYLHDIKQGRELVLNPNDKTVRIQDRGRGSADLIDTSGTMSPREFFDKLGQIEQTAVGRLGERETDGRKLIGFVLPRDSSTEANRMLRHVWVDPQTRLPVRYEVLPEEPNDLAQSFKRYTVSFTFNRPLDASLFRLVPPEGYTVLNEAGAFIPYLDRLPLPPKDEKLASPIIVPGVGIGEARFGMGVEKVIEVLGRPDDASYYWEPTPEETRQTDEAYLKASKDADEKGLKGSKKMYFISEMTNRNSPKITKRAPSGMILDYISRGFDLIVLKDQGLVRVFCYGKNLGKRPFTGKTPAGIGLGSTMREIENAFGPPFKKSETLLDGVPDTMLYYKSLGLIMQLRDGQLSSLSCEKPPAPKPARESGGRGKATQKPIQGGGKQNDQR